MRDIDVMNYMIDHGSITVQEGAIHCHTTETRKAISNLRERGHVITDMWCSVIKPDGKVKRFKRYFWTGLMNDG